MKDINVIGALEVQFRIQQQLQIETGRAALKPIVDPGFYDSQGELVRHRVDLFNTEFDRSSRQSRPTALGEVAPGIASTGNSAFDFMNKRHYNQNIRLGFNPYDGIILP